MIESHPYIVIFIIIFLIVLFLILYFIFPYFLETDEKDKSKESDNRSNSNNSNTRNSRNTRRRRRNADTQRESDNSENGRNRNRDDKEKSSNRNDKEKSNNRDDREKSNNRNDKEKSNNRDDKEKSNNRNDKEKSNNRNNKEKSNDRDDKEKLNNRNDKEKSNNRNDKEKSNNRNDKEKSNNRNDKEKSNNRNDKRLRDDVNKSESDKPIFAKKIMKEDKAPNIKRSESKKNFFITSKDPCPKCHLEKKSGSMISWASNNQTNSSNPNNSNNSSNPNNSSNAINPNNSSNPINRTRNKGRCDNQHVIINGKKYDGKCPICQSLIEWTTNSIPYQEVKCENNHKLAYDHKEMWAYDAIFDPITLSSLSSDRFSDRSSSSDCYSDETSNKDKSSDEYESNEKQEDEYESEEATAAINQPTINSQGLKKSSTYQTNNNSSTYQTNNNSSTYQTEANLQLTKSSSYQTESLNSSSNKVVSLSNKTASASNKSGSPAIMVVSGGLFTPLNVFMGTSDELVNMGTLDNAMKNQARVTEIIDENVDANVINIEGNEKSLEVENRREAENKQDRERLDEGENKQQERERLNEGEKEPLVIENRERLDEAEKVEIGNDGIVEEPDLVYIEEGDNDVFLIDFDATPESYIDSKGRWVKPLVLTEYSSYTTSSICSDEESDESDDDTDESEIIEFETPLIQLQKAKSNSTLDASLFSSNKADSILSGISQKIKNSLKQFNQPKKEDSYGEIESRRVLESIYRKPFKKGRYDFLRTPDTNKKLELDGYNPELKIAFEYNGEYHYLFPHIHNKDEAAFRRRQFLDAFKIQRCRELGIKLIVIPALINWQNLPLYQICGSARHWKKLTTKEIEGYIRQQIAQL